MPKKIILVRHGETDYNINRIFQGHLDIPLNNNGHLQAQAVISQFSSLSVDAIYSSDLKRALTTAKYLAKEKGMKIHRTKKLREHNLGVFQGWDWAPENDYRHELWRKFIESVKESSDSDWNEHQGESIKEFRNRIRSFLAHLHTHHQEQTLAVFTHGGTIRRFLEIFRIVEYGGGGHAQNTEIVTLIKSGEAYQIER